MTEHGVLMEADLGRCPSCHTIMALPRGMLLDKLHTCPECGASSYGYKWQADLGRAAASRINGLLKEMRNA